MKKIGMNIDFKTDTAVMFGTPINLHVTKSGHYTLSLTPPTQLLAHQLVDKNVKIALTATTNLMPKHLSYTGNLISPQWVS